MPRPLSRHLGGPVSVQDDLDPGAVAAERLINGVIEDLPEAVLQAPPIGRPDVHARALPDGLQALKHRQVAGGVRRGLRLAGLLAERADLAEAAGLPRPSLRRQ